MKHGLLYGSYELSLDEKNRLPIPSDVRRCIEPDRDGKALFIVVGTNRKLWFYCERYYEELVSHQTQELMPAEEALAFDQLNFATAVLRELDEQARIIIPRKLLEKTGTTKKVTLIGVRDHLELWNRDEWEAWSDELEKRRPEVALRARQMRQSTDA